MHHHESKMRADEFLERPAFALFQTFLVLAKRVDQHGP